MPEEPSKNSVSRSPLQMFTLKLPKDSRACIVNLLSLINITEIAHLIKVADMNGQRTSLFLQTSEKL